MAALHFTTPFVVLNPFTGAPIARRFLQDPKLFALAIEEDCADMTDAEIEEMDQLVAYQEIEYLLAQFDD